MKKLGVITSQEKVRVKKGPLLLYENSRDRQMTIDPGKNLVIIKGTDHTDDILEVTREADRTIVTYKNGKSYRYAHSNVECFSDPESIPVDTCRLQVDGDIVSNIVEVLRFGSLVKIIHGSGGSRCCPYSEVSRKRITSSGGRSRDVLAYFRELSEGFALKTDDGDSLLAMKYRHLNIVSQESILYRFLHPHASGSVPDPPCITSNLIFPFASNMSQKTGVARALRFPVSLVQGPPGTGKTQTILNLIANMLLQGKRVAVVSSNNSATANVLEKLKKYELDFVTAFLGSTKNKKAFINGQTKEASRLPILQGSREVSIREEISYLNREMDKAFDAKNELADVIQEIDALRLELSHFEKFQQETEDQTSNGRGLIFRPKSASHELMHYWQGCEQKIRRRAYSKPEVEFRRHTGFLEKVILLWRFGMAGRALFQFSVHERISVVQKAYYLRKQEEMNARRERLENLLEEFSFDERLGQLTGLSMQLLKHRLAKRFNNRERKIFTLDDLWKSPEEFLDEYPIVLSTTFSVITSVRNGYLFDCVIVDEASQVDLLNGILAMACAKKLVIVGDPMQLPNVLTDKDKERAGQVAVRYEIPEYARYEEHNLLSALQAAFPKLPGTLLREHYRCHPKIIQFCNRKFYGGELLLMTHDQGEPDVLKVYMTVGGRHARGTINQRQIDEIVQYVLPELGPVDPADIGIVSPYRAQAIRIQSSVTSKEIEVDTVHKYQGREKRVMIIATVANEANEFVDNPNLLNVAVSRAQEKLRLVVSKEMAEGNSNIADFVRYIRYSNGEVLPGRVRSIFDLLYGEYTAARLEMLKNKKRISKYDSENLAYYEIEAVLMERDYRAYGVVLQFPLSMLIKDFAILTTEEAAYAAHPWTRTDFLLYRKVDKCPVLVIEVDGYAFHRKKSRQAERDVLKDSVLKKSGVPILRLSTIGSNEQSRIREKLEDTHKDRYSYPMSL